MISLLASRFSLQEEKRREETAHRGVKEKEWWQVA